MSVFEDSLASHMARRSRGEVKHDYPHLRDLKPDTSVMDRSLTHATRQSVRLNPAELPKGKK